MPLPQIFLLRHLSKNLKNVCLLVFLRFILYRNLDSNQVQLQGDPNQGESEREREKAGEKEKTRKNVSRHERTKQVKIQQE